MVRYNWKKKKKLMSIMVSCLLQKKKINFPMCCKSQHSTGLCDYHLDRRESGSCKFNLKCYEVAYFSSRHRCQQHMKLNQELRKVLKVFCLEVRSLKEIHFTLCVLSKPQLGRKSRKKSQNIFLSNSTIKWEISIFAINQIIVIFSRFDGGIKMVFC